VMRSLSQASAPSAATETVTEPAGSRGLLVSVCGSVTGTPWDLLRERVKRTKVASRKKMTSISGMISIRAFFLPPPSPDEPPAMGWFGLGRGEPDADQAATSLFLMIRSRALDAS